jgi:hypothetical protein
MMERRWNARKAINLDIALYYNGLGMLRCMARDISLEGMFVETGSVIMLPHNAPVEVVFDTREGKQWVQHRLPALVVRTADDGVGMMFSSVARDTHRALLDMVQAGEGTAAAIPMQ